MNTIDSMRWQMLRHALTGKMDRVMLRVHEECLASGKKSDLTRIGNFRWALTHITIWSGKKSGLMLFPYGPNVWYTSRKNVDIRCVLFAFHWRK